MGRQINIFLMSEDVGEISEQLKKWPDAVLVAFPTKKPRTRIVDTLTPLPEPGCDWRPCVDIFTPDSIKAIKFQYIEVRDWYQINGLYLSIDTIIPSNEDTIEKQFPVRFHIDTRTHPSVAALYDKLHKWLIKRHKNFINPPFGFRCRASESFMKKFKVKKAQ